MTIPFRCRCGKSLRARDELAGKRVKCPQCGQVSVLPAPAAALAAVAAPLARAPRPRKVLLPDGRAEKGPDTPEAPSGPDGPPAPYQVDLGAWCRTANAHYQAVLGPMAGYLLIFVGILAALVLLALILVGYLGFFLLLPHLAAGPTIVCLMQLRGKKWAFGDFFAGFRRYGTWLALELLATLILVGSPLPGLLVGMLAGAVSYALRLDPDSPVMMVPGMISMLVSLAGLLAGVYVWFRAGVFARQLVIDRGCGAVDALKGSWHLTRGHFWGLFGAFLLVVLGVEAASLLTCGIGLFFALPYGLLVLNAGYLHVAGTPSRRGPGMAEGVVPAAVDRPMALPPAKPNTAAVWRIRWPWVAAGAGAGVLMVVAALVVWFRPAGVHALPGAAGPRVVKLAELAEPIQVQRVYLTDNPHERAVPDEWNQTLPSGTREVWVGIVFPWQPPDGTQVSVELLSESGPLTMPKGSIVMTISSGRGFTVLLPSSARGGLLRDGRYQSKVLVNGTAVALLNWSVGDGRRPRAVKPVAAPDEAAPAPAAGGPEAAFPRCPPGMQLKKSPAAFGC